MPRKVRDYKQERKTAIARGETGVGSKSGDATRHRARRQMEKKVGALSSDKHVDHKKGIGAGNSPSNLRVRPASDNMAHGGRKGSKKGKSAGGRKGALSKKK
ncbi:hypothetical protein PQC39_gp012 [Vibrio phage Vp_R1]|uniref:HNH endonuclease n=1 Tax=Vibrio phage Vp_R1 TaxID=2059867 RepID=A0A2H5BQF5_9CAUD|nr:hypothetical protein PQC39_gp012 [Vibrio phage Vp_R1]AUG88376.1 hypothetical protein VPR_012 [Vibrio phage Vp_R1]